MPARFSREAIQTPTILGIAAIIWGLVPVATRYLLSSFAPLQLVLVRFLIASIFFLPLLWPLRGYRWTFKELAWAVFCGLVGVIGYYVLVAYGQQFIPAGMAGLLLATQPIWILLISAGVVREKISWSVWLGLIVALGGMLLLLGQETFQGNWHGPFLAGSLLVLVSALMWSIYTVAVRSLSKRIGARSSTALTMLIGTLPLLFFWRGQTWSILLHLSLVAWLALGLLAVGSTVLAAVLWNYGVARTTSARAGLFLYLVPLVSVSGGALFLHEQIGLAALASGVLIIVGVALAQLPQAGRSQKTAASQS